MGKKWIDDNEKCRRIAGNFDCHAGEAVWRGVQGGERGGSSAPRPNFLFWSPNTYFEINTWNFLRFFSELWIRHGRFSSSYWHWHIHWQCSMGYSLNIPHSIKSLTRCSYIWTRYALQHSVRSWLEINWRLQASQTDRSNTRENNKWVDYDYKVGDKILIHKDGILRKAVSIWKKEPRTITTTVHTNGTIRIQCGTKSERINIQRVSEELLI